MDLAGQNFRTLRSKHAVASAARDVEQNARRLIFATALPYEGMFLSACAQFELAIRNLVEAFVNRASLKHAAFSTLPAEMRDRHRQGCANILQNLHRNKFKHLSGSTLIASLASCDNIPSGTRYRLIPEAYSSSESNFRSNVVNEHLRNLGMKDTWRIIGSKAILKTNLASMSDQITAERAKLALDGLMTRRNQLVHRGTSYTAPSEADVRECAEFFTSLIQAIAEALEDHLHAI
jgi:hypothetical protein